jgi:uncharacterized protein YegL
VRRTTHEVKGDWKPLVFLFTDGMPTDNLQQGIDTLDMSRLGIFVACAAGPRADTSALQSITECVVRLDSLDSNTIASFFKWVSASVSASSVKIDLTKRDVTTLDELPPPPKEVQLVL